MVVPQNGWFRRENPIYKNGRFRGTTILGKLHFYWHRIGVNFWLHRIGIVEQQGPSTKHTSALRCAISCDELVRWIWGLWVLAFWVWWRKQLEAVFGGEVVGSTPMHEMYVMLVPQHLWSQIILLWNSWKSMLYKGTELKHETTRFLAK
jgi:hypothetical protein